MKRLDKASWLRTVGGQVLLSTVKTHTHGQVHRCLLILSTFWPYTDTLRSHTHRDRNTHCSWSQPTPEITVAFSTASFPQNRKILLGLGNRAEHVMINLAVFQKVWTGWLYLHRIPISLLLLVCGLCQLNTWVVVPYGMRMESGVQSKLI